MSEQVEWTSTTVFRGYSIGSRELLPVFMGLVLLLQQFTLHYKRSGLIGPTRYTVAWALALVLLACLAYFLAEIGFVFL